jgi:cobalt-zinc-cadmium efflux system protein
MENIIKLNEFRNDHYIIQRKLKIIFVVSISTFVFQITGGILSNSLALIADSFHLLIDFSAIGITLFAFRIANKPHSPKLTFGFHRVEILAAFINGITLIIMAAIILFEAYQRFFHPSEIETEILLIFASIGLAANIVMIILLKPESKSNLNIKGAYLHVIGDLLSSVGVIVGALIIYFISFPIIDTIVSVGIAILILRSGLLLCKKCLYIFMEGTPTEINSKDISKELEHFEEITEIHDLHVWALTSNLYAMTVHVKVKPEFLQRTNELLKKINQIMKQQFGITHCTIQIESDQDLIKPN